MNNLRLKSLASKSKLNTCLDSAMTVISKQLFYEKFPSDLPCSTIHSWESNCTLSVLHVAKEVVFGAATFYAPIYLVRLHTIQIL